MASSFKLYVPAATVEDAESGNPWAYYSEESNGRDVRWDGYSEDGLYELEVTVTACRPIVVPYLEFEKLIKNVDEPGEAYDDYCCSGELFDVWWSTRGKATYSLETDDAVAALKELMGQ